MSRLAYVWDYDLDEADFRRLLAGEITLGRLDRTWAAVRLIEYAPYREIVRLLGFRELVKGWPEWRAAVFAFADHVSEFYAACSPKQPST